MGMNYGETTMSEKNKKEKENYSFIREHIKEKPISRKRLIIYAIICIFMGALFGLAACVVNTIVTPWIQEWQSEKSSVDIPQDEQPVDTEEPTAEETEPDVVIEQQELEVTDYQELQTKLYAIGKTANKSIVTVTGVTSDTDVFDTAYESEGQESGLILGANEQSLLILTEEKVISGADQIKVTFINEDVQTAELINYDGNTGLAVLKVDLATLSDDTKNAISYATLGNSYKVTQGEVVIAAGSPLGNVYSILNGTITSTENEISVDDSVYTIFTTDMVGTASGSGVLLNLDGEVVGIIMMDYSNSSDQNTITAISVSELKSIIQRLSNGEDIAYFGAKMSTVTDALAEEYEIPQGVYIKSVEIDSPAMAAGLQTGDVITAVDDIDIKTVDDWEDYLEGKKPGQTVSVTVMRLGNGEYKEITCNATLTKLD